MNTKTTKIYAGEYQITDGENTVRISFIEHLGEWIAQAEWDEFLMTDPQPTKRNAKRNAENMLAAA